MDFESLIVERPKEALKHLEGLKDNVAWNYFEQKLLKEVKACRAELTYCALDKVLFVRGYLKGIEYAQGLFNEVAEELKDEIALKKEAAKVERARLPDALDSKYD